MNTGRQGCINGHFDAGRQRLILGQVAATELVPNDPGAGMAEYVDLVYRRHTQFLGENELQYRSKKCQVHVLLALAHPKNEFLLERLKVENDLLIVNKDGRFSKHDEEKTQFRSNQSKHGNPSGHNDQLGEVKDIPIGAYSGIGFYASSLAPTRHRVKKSLDEGETNLLPFFLKLGELFIGIPCISSYKAALQLGPYPLVNAKVWGLAWPVKECHMTAGKPVLDVLGSVLRIIILLENEATTKRIACIRTHGVLKDVFILKFNHDSLNLPQGTHAKARDASPNRGISTPMLHCWNLVLGVETSALETTNPLYPIRTKQHVFAFITPTSSPFFMVQPLCAFAHARLAILRRDNRFLGGASSIQSSRLKPTPDSPNKGF
ncbi:hypothetical protein AVEN_93679-1 [Araneus ventricosus]|uniref:Uncharacterized protein n=1 Tax=Araneus ventricosus TaxID=182803 RepID=A0A4Y2RTV9_ARAVE|nr:hypothetical protein AVEN_93679-1 [Araneus ventricosus]